MVQLKLFIAVLLLSVSAFSWGSSFPRQYDPITHACEYIRKNELPLSDLATILVRLRGIHLASRQSDKTVLEIRELGTKITDQSVQSKNQAVHASVRAAIILYLVLRTLAKDNL